MSYTEWLNNEYDQWIKALQESTVDNFGSHPMVRRMLGKPTISSYETDWVYGKAAEDIEVISKIGGDTEYPNSIIVRMVYYAQKVLKDNPTAIVEIGGGVGQFYAVMRALGYKGTYFIYDLPEVRVFQRKYLDRVTELTGLNTETLLWANIDFDYCVSFYALGEFDDELKSWYIENVVKKCPHGLIIWNPHSGSSEEIGFDCKVEPEYPLTSPNNKMLTW